jgi:hypothetical protein
VADYVTKRKLQPYRKVKDWSSIYESIHKDFMRFGSGSPGFRVFSSKCLISFEQIEWKICFRLVIFSKWTYFGETSPSHAYSPGVSCFNTDEEKIVIDWAFWLDSRQNVHSVGFLSWWIQTHCPLTNHKIFWLVYSTEKNTHTHTLEGNYYHRTREKTHTHSRGKTHNSWLPSTAMFRQGWKMRESERPHHDQWLFFLQLAVGSLRGFPRAVDAECGEGMWAI